MSDQRQGPSGGNGPPGAGSAAPPLPRRAQRRRHGSLIASRPLPLRHTRGRSWNPILWLWRIWRYGWYHPDEDLLGVIDAAGDALRAQVASARAVLTGEALAEARRIEQEIEDELNERVPELANLLGLESRINALYPPAIQRRRAWMIRERFERVAPARAAIQYWASNPPDPGAAGMVEEDLRRAEAAVREAGEARERSAADLESAESDSDAACAERDARRAEIVDRTEEEIEAMLAELRALRRGGGADEAQLRSLEEAIGALLTARDAAEAAEAQLDEARAADSRAGEAVRSAEAHRAVARARLELVRVQRELSDAAAAARAMAASGAADPSALAEAEETLARLRREHDSAQEALDARQWELEDLGAEALAADRRPAGYLGAVDADAQTLLGYTHSSYLMSVGRERAVRDLMRWLMMRFWSANILAALILAAVYLAFDWLPGHPYLSLGNLVIGLFFIAAVGRIGATMSVVQRLQGAVGGNILARDPMLELTRLRTGKNGINLALFSGAVFALLLYAIFASGVARTVGLEGGLFPEMAMQMPDRQSPPAATPSPAGEDKPEGTGGAPDTLGDGGADEGAPADEAAANESVAVIPAEAPTPAPVPAAAPAEEAPAAAPTGAEAGAGGRIAHVDDSTADQCKAYEACDPFIKLGDALGFAGRADFFKLLIWAFLAGFAERLVPDVLDSLTRRTRAGVRAEEDAAAQRRGQAAAGGPAGSPPAAPPPGP